MPVHEQISAARDCGRVTCGTCPASELLAVARHFGLSTVPGTYREIDRGAAEALIVTLLHHDLAYQSELMPRARAEALAGEFLAAVPADARFYANGDPTSWTPATRATFDLGVLAVSAGGSSCFWIEDED
jgi:hypothetical protein